MIDGIKRKNGNVDHDFASDILTGGPAWKTERMDRVEIAIPHLAKRPREREDTISWRIIRRDATPRIGVSRDVDGELSDNAVNRHEDDKREAGRNN